MHGYGHKHGIYISGQSGEMPIRYWRRRDAKGMVIIRSKDEY